MCNTKAVRGVVLLLVTLGGFLGNMESQEAVAQAPVKNGIVAVDPARLWSDHLHLEKSTTATASAVTKEVQKVKKKQKKKTQGTGKGQATASKKQGVVSKEKKTAGKRKQAVEKKYIIKTGNEGIRILERIVEAEAGDQGHLGKRLVANVIINRVKSSQFPSTIKGVVFAPRQFSPITDGAYARAVVTRDTKKAVREALQGIDYSQGALYFMDRRYADSSNIQWFDSSLTRLFRYHGHEFYK